MNIYDSTSISTEEVLNLLTSSSTGLSAEERRKRFLQYGANEIRAEDTKWTRIFLRQFHSPFVYLLIGAAGLTFFLQEYLDSAMILAFVALNTTLGFYQEFKSEKTLRLLRQYLIAEDNILEDGKKKKVPVSSLVPGDIVFFEPGDIIPADVRFISENNLAIDESVLTGESILVPKGAKDMSEPAREPFEAKNLGFSGTTVAAGNGTGVVLATGRETVFGKIASLTAETNRVSVLEKELTKFSAFILKLILATLIVVFIANVFLKGADADIFSLLLFSVALAIGVIPEALPVVMTFSLSRGARVLAKNHAVIKRLSAIEDLGGIEILCTDKTGTITENNLTVSGYFPTSQQHDIFFFGSVGPLARNDEKELAKNSFEAALLRGLTEDDRERSEKWKTLLHLPFDPERRMESVFVEHEGATYAVTRGAPEKVLALCQEFGAEGKSAALAWIAKESKSGKRVFAIAQKQIPPEAIQLSGDKTDEGGLALTGIVSFIDPIKSSAKDAVERSKKLGVSVKILTGDMPEVAGAVAYEIGLITDRQKVVPGDAFERMTEAEKESAAFEYDVFARISPKQKYDIIRILQKTKNVGFLGEGINDAPALKIANVALVVQSASDIAREAADIVLLQKSLLVIVQSIEEGRKVFANTVKYIRATLSSNFGNFYAVAIASFFIDFLPMLPLQILLLNLLSDFPMIAVSTDTVDKEEIRRPESYNVREIVLFATVLGLVSTIFDFIYFALFYQTTPAGLQTSWFIGSVLTELLFLFSIRTQKVFLSATRASSTLIILSGLAFFLTLAIPYMEIGQSVFKFSPPTIHQLILIVGIALAYFTTTETVKLLYARTVNHREKSPVGIGA